MIAHIVTCPARAASCAATIAQLASSDWGAEPVIHLDASRAGLPIDRINATWRAALSAAARAGAVSLILEDDVALNVNLRHNLERWEPLGTPVLLGFLYGGSSPTRREAGPAWFSVDPVGLWGAQGVVISPPMAAHVLAHWNDEDGCADTRMPRLAGRLGPVYLHAPSLVQHVGTASTWGGPFHQAADFDPTWRAP